jgi:hypothetical protein
MFERDLQFLIYVAILFFGGMNRGVLILISIIMIMKRIEHFLCYTLSVAYSFLIFDKVTKNLKPSIVL